MNVATKILQNKPNYQTVFTSSEIGQLIGIFNKITLHSSLIYATNKGYIYRVSKGIYVLKEDYNRQEFANKYRTPSYISLYTALQNLGIIFQIYDSIYAVTTRFEETEIDSQKYIYRKIKDSILLNPLGIRNEKGVNVATAERAICDKLYLDGDEYFDNLRDINWNQMRELNEKVYLNNITISNFINKNQK